VWAPLPPEVMSRLARQGTANGAPRTPVRPDGGWEARVAELDSYRALADDYDGQGAIPPGGEVIAGAIELARQLDGAGVIPPTCVAPGVNGTANLEWDLPGKTYVTVEVTGRNAAEVFLMTPDGETALWDLGPVLTA
jgi:hypothetical protein